MGMDPLHSPVPGLERLLTIDELATYLGIPKQTIYDLRVDGRGPRAYKLGKRLRFTAGDVRVWMETQREPDSPSHAEVG
ncbi:hypothetical protein BH24ACT15_BH24ACT15_32620 [soil metagenome]